MGLGGNGESLHLQDGLAGLGRLLVDHKLHVAAHHHAAELFPGGIGNVDGADVLALAQHRAAVGHLHDLVELVGDKEDGLALRRQGAHDLHELFDLLGRQNSSGLVENEDLIVPVEHL